MKFIIVLSAFFVNLTAFSQSSIEGSWSTGVDSVVIDIYPASDHWEGKVISSDNAKAELGKIVLKNLVKVDEHWEGEFYIPPLGSWLDAKLIPNDQEMEVTAYAWFISKTKMWTKIEETIPIQE